MNLLSDLAQERISTSRGAMLRAFAYVIETAGRRRVTDLHVRRLLCYVRAHDRYYTGVPKSLARLAHMLFLSVPTCRRVIRRAVEEFNLLIVIPQRHHPGGQTVNRYTINWDNVDAILYDAELADCTTANAPPVTTDHPPSALLESSYSLNDYGLQPNSPARLIARHATTHPKNFQLPSPLEGEGSRVRGVFQHNGKVDPSQMYIESSTPEDSINDLILEDRILNSHPRILRLPKRLLNSLTLKDWPNTVRRAPKDTPKELLAHFDVLLTKLQMAMDRAKQLGATKIQDRLMTLWHKLSAVHYRASHAALCRTNLPPINPPPERSLNAHPWSDFDFDAFNARVAATYAQMRARLSQPSDGLTPPALSDHPPDTIASAARTIASAARTIASAARTGDQAPVELESLGSSSFSACSAPSAVKSSCALSSCGLTREVFSLLVALDELLSALTAARQCASDYGITWLQNRFTTFRRRVKAIRAKVNALTEVHSQAHDDQAPPYSLN